MKKTEFNIAKMDCPSEEQMIRMKLEGLDGIKQLDFDIANRKLSVSHAIDSTTIFNLIKELKLNASIISETTINHYEEGSSNNAQERKILWWVLFINLSFFFVEQVYGWLSHSMGLVADSLDMLADSLVYSMSLMAVGSATIRKKKVAIWSGYFQLFLAIIGLLELFRRFFRDSIIPEFQEMIVVSVFALIANSICLYLIQKTKSKEAHIQASAIFTSNDIIINTGVIVAGILVYFTESKYPDLVIGLIIFTIVTKGALRILKLGK